MGVTGTLLGAEPRIQVGEAVVHLAPGDALLVFTDGLTEARATDGGELGEPGLREILATAPSTSANALVDDDVQDALEFAGGGLADDLAAVGVLAPA